KERPDVTSVVHAHPTYATAFGIAGVNILPVGNRGAIFAPQVPILDFDRQIDTPERGRMCRDAIGDGLALVLKNHGVAVCGDSIENATIATFALRRPPSCNGSPRKWARCRKSPPARCVAC